MLLIEILIIVVAVLLIVNILISLKAARNTESVDVSDIKVSLNNLIQNLKDTEKNLKDEFSTNRKESADNAKALREEVGNKLDAFTKTFSEQLTAFQNIINANNRDSRKELKDNLELFKTDLNNGLKNFNDKIRENFTDFVNNQKTQNEANNLKLSELKTTLENSIGKMQEANEKKLEEMRVTVDEKLQKTLETRLTQSFEIVNKSLESVQKGLGEMQKLAVGVGDLKKVLSGVKSRGILGEIQLGAILEEILSAEQYKKNVVTKAGSRDNVEYAICLPGKEEEGKYCYLPIDSKFPIEDYRLMVDAYEAGDASVIEAAKKGVENAIKKCAKDIRDKYLDPPNTTDFGIMFLPFEGLYAEVVRNTTLIEVLQRDFNIIVTGPSTLAALLSSLRLGFRTLAIEKRSGEIRKTLSAVKTEFNKFGDVLKKAKEKIDKASDDIDELVGARTKKIQSKLKSFEELPAQEAALLIDNNIESEEAEDVKE